MAVSLSKSTVKIYVTDAQGAVQTVCLDCAVEKRRDGDTWSPYGIDPEVGATCAWHMSWIPGKGA